MPQVMTSATDPFNSGATVRARFEEIAAIHGLRPAIVDGDRTLSYAVMDRMANRVAHGICAATSEAGDPVCIYLSQGSAAITAILGCLKAGRCYVPLDPAFPAERTRAIVAAAGARLLIASERSGPDAAGLFSSGIRRVDIESLLRDGAEHSPDIAFRGDVPAYVIYTSGSTGKPKGVMQCQRNLLVNAINQITAFGIGPEDRLPLLYSPSVMGAVRVLFNALLSGAALHCVDIKNDGFGALRDCMLRERITVYHSVATLFRHFCATLSGEVFPDLRYVILGGEAATSGDYALFERHFRGALGLYTGYGSTETGSVCVRLLQHGESPPPGNLAPGYALPGVQIHIVDEQLNELSLGEEGEILVGGPGLASCYWGDAELTDRSFLRLHGSDASVCFRTGDLGRMDGNGLLTHTGRRDFQVKVRGFKVDVAEVEAELLAVEGVRDACVVGRPDQHGETCLVAFYTCENDIPDSAFSKRISVRLPRFMLPARYVRIPELPLTVNNKVDRPALRAMTLDEQARPSTEHEADGSSAEALRQIWQDLLGVRVNDRNADFFELGGNSLLAARMADAIRTRMHRDVPIGQILSSPTIEGLASAIDNSLSMSPVIKLRNGNAGIPLFFVHSPRPAMNIAQALRNGDRAVHVLSVFGIASLRDAGGAGINIGRVAEELARTVRETQVRGPYQLATFCGDSLLTLELARQLIATGDEVAHVFLIDGLLQPHRVSWRGRVRALRKERLTEILAVSRAKLKQKLDRSTASRREEEFAVNPDASDGGEGLRRVRDLDRLLYQSYQRAKREYVPQPLSSDGVVLFLSSEWFDADQARLRSCVTGNITVEEIPGHHHFIVEKPLVQRLAERIEHHMDAPVCRRTV